MFARWAPLCRPGSNAGLERAAESLQSRIQCSALWLWCCTGHSTSYSPQPGLVRKLGRTLFMRRERPMRDAYPLTQNTRLVVAHFPSQKPMRFVQYQWNGYTVGDGSVLSSGTARIWPILLIRQRLQKESKKRQPLPLRQVCNELTISLR